MVCETCEECMITFGTILFSSVITAIGIATSYGRAGIEDAEMSSLWDLYFI